MMLRHAIFALLLGSWLIVDPLAAQIFNRQPRERMTVRLPRIASWLTSSAWEDNPQETEVIGTITRIPESDCWGLTLEAAEFPRPIAELPREYERNGLRVIARLGNSGRNWLDCGAGASRTLEIKSVRRLEGEYVSGFDLAAWAERIEVMLRDAGLSGEAQVAADHVRLAGFATTDFSTVDGLLQDQYAFMTTQFERDGPAAMELWPLLSAQE